MKVTVEIINDCESHWVPDETLCRRWIHTALNTASFRQDSSVSLSFVTMETSAHLNEQYRGKSAATNVLSFPSEFPEDLTRVIKHQPLGDIVLCPAVVEREASEQNKELQAHWAHLLIHGVLHLLGHEHTHKADAREMEQLEISALQILGIPDPYLIG